MSTFVGGDAFLLEYFLGLLDCYHSFLLRVEGVKLHQQVLQGFGVIFW